VLSERDLLGGEAIIHLYPLIFSQFLQTLILFPSFPLFLFSSASACTEINNYDGQKHEHYWLDLTKTMTDSQVKYKIPYFLAEMEL